jgi:hypothetical protein
MEQGTNVFRKMLRPHNGHPCPQLGDEDFIGLHLKEIGQGHPYSYWSGLARSTTSPKLAAQDEAIATTLFQGDTLQTMLNTAWTFWTIGQIAFITFWVLLAAGLVVLGTGTGTAPAGHLQGKLASAN